MKAAFAVGSPQPHGPGGFRRPCAVCSATVYMHDRFAHEAERALCLDCFARMLETDEDVALILPAGWTPAMFLAMLRDRGRVH